MTISSRSASVEFCNVSRRYGQVVVAVDDVSFTVDAGTLVTLLGPSGCGKTTTLRMIAGLEMPSDGQIFIGGKNVTTLPPTERDVSMVFQSYALFPHMTVLENVAYGLAGSGLSRTAIKDKARDALKLVGLTGYDDRLPSELSGGQQQRVAVTRALVLEPQVLLFDEPLSNLDAKLRRRMRDDIRDLQQRLGLTSVYVTHDQEEALAVSDRIILMNQGKIAQDGAPKDLYDRPVDRFVADFIGGANLLPCEVLSRNDTEATVRLGTMTLKLPHRGVMTGAATLAIRPSAAQLLSQAHPESSLTAEVKKSTYLGTHWEYTLTTDVGDIFVTDYSGGIPARPGDSIHVAFPGKGLALLPR